jgi:ATP-dependent Clp protease ATP-binding subunit ClpA
MMQFSQEYKTMINQAAEVAQRFNHNYFDSEHLLAGMIRVPGCMAAEIIFTELCLSADEVALALAPVLDTPPSRQAVKFPLEWNFGAKRVLERALRASLKYGHPSIGTEHILLGIAQAEYSLALKALSSLDVESAELQGVVMNYIRTATAKGRKPSPR